MSRYYPPDWHDFALCRQADPEAWFVPKGGNAKPAQAICRRCTVTNLCLEEALSMPPIDDRYGIRAGTTPNQRTAIRRKRARTGRVVALPIPAVPAARQDQEAA